MVLKIRDYLAILPTSRLLTFLETVAKKTSRKIYITAIDKSAYNQTQRVRAGTGEGIHERESFPSPNARCGFATGKGF